MIIQALRNVRILRALTALFVVSSTVMFSGCGGTMQTYEGPKLQPSEVAIIKPYYFYTIFDATVKGAERVNIDKIDGKNLGFSDKCTVIPGTHKISINVPVSMDIVFDAEAGHVYTVCGTRVQGGAVWVIDDTTQKVVAKNHELGKLSVSPFKKKPKN